MLEGSGSLSLLLLLHPVTQVGWTGWSVHWSTVVGIAALAALYFWRAMRAPSPGTPTGLQKLSFASGLFVMFASLNGPVHDLSDYYLFSAHMVQHLLLTMLLPPLLIAGTPGWMLRPLLRNQRVFKVARFILRPIMCFVIFNLTLVVWHLPFFYNAAMADHNVHIVEHLMFMATAVLMWWPFMSPLPELPRLAYPGQMLYCFLTTLPMSVVAVYISMADHILYPAYASTARIWGMMPMVDQQVGGLIMWIPGSSIFYVILTVVFFKWAARGEDHSAAAQVDWVPSRMLSVGPE